MPPVVTTLERFIAVREVHCFRKLELPVGLTAQAQGDTNGHEFDVE